MPIEKLLNHNIKTKVDSNQYIDLSELIYMNFITLI